ncbi:unnamed protein product [Lepeophtheirus salmonis]|uniref:(salmon louse) hypothetical protein n=1 Tax=Lepeophtheirus salmonis TaxID=72036 RepID=A0A7R8H4D5_LEPSM|nr:unnamed protein product [Lepeophtheirus salmonis]CAF2847955.1 unnamed protein product [Lepeophtheirus salmonis]
MILSQIKFFVLLLTLRYGAAFSDNPLSSSGWTPVVGSKLVDLPTGYIEEPQRPVKIAQEGVPNDEERSFEKKRFKLASHLAAERNNIQFQTKPASVSDVEPFIIYPEGTFTSSSTSPPIRTTSLPPPTEPPFTGRPVLRPRHPLRQRQRPNLVPSRSREAPPPPPPPQQIPQGLPQRPRFPPPSRQRPPIRHNRPPIRGPPPPKKGISLPGIGSSIQCFTEDVAADYRLSDKNYMQSQIKCVLNEGPCDKIGGAIKRLAPEIFRGRCPHPCNPCKKKQIQKNHGKGFQRVPL